MKYEIVHTNEADQALYEATDMLVYTAQYLAGGRCRCNSCNTPIEKDETVYSLLFFDKDDENCLNGIEIMLYCTVCVIATGRSVIVPSLDL